MLKDTGAKMQLLNLKSEVGYNPYAEPQPERRNPIVGVMQILGGLVTFFVRLVGGIILAVLLVMVFAVLLKLLLL